MDLSRIQYVVLRNGVKMPIFGLVITCFSLFRLGTSHDGGYNHEAVVYALKDCNYKLIDTAKRYGCEEMLQMAIKESKVSREEIFLTSKLWPSDYGFHSAQIACNGSMQRLGVDYLGMSIKMYKNENCARCFICFCFFYLFSLDLYMLHWPHCPSIYPDPKALRQETWRALELMYDEGLLKSIGVSNFLPSHLEELEETASVLPHINQIEFHPYQNPVQVRKYCESSNIQLEGFCPLAKGRILNESPIVNIAKKMKKTPAQILIRWSLQNGVVTIPKSTKKHRIFENCQVFDFNLSHDDMQTLSLLHDGRRCVDVSKVQSKIDTIATDGYKLQLGENGIIKISMEN
uniref:NADP-dependent oxidoreductase domain-containing protein n=1 Tax=Strigamia maritima TaxID=126957 RepID=T1J1M3_STRMM